METNVNQLKTSLAAAALVLVPISQASAADCSGALQMTTHDAYIAPGDGGGEITEFEPGDSSKAIIQGDSKIDFRVDRCYDDEVSDDGTPLRRRLVWTIKVGRAMCGNDSSIPQPEKQFLIRCRNSVGDIYVVNPEGTGNSQQNNSPSVPTRILQEGLGVRFGGSNRPFVLDINEMATAWARTERVGDDDGDGVIKCKLYEKRGDVFEWDWQAGKVDISYDVYDTCKEDIIEP